MPPLILTQTIVLAAVVLSALCGCAATAASSPSRDASGVDEGAPRADVFDDALALDAAVLDAAASDSAATRDATAPDAPASTDGPASRCGTLRPDLSELRNAGYRGLVIARDGTLYYGQSNTIGRLRPGRAPEPDWVTLMQYDLPTLALDPTNRSLYVTTGTRDVYIVDTATATAVVHPFVSARNSRGVTVDASGNLYYSDSSNGGVRRITPSGVASAANTTPIAAATGLAFGPEGALYVLNEGGNLFRLTLGADGVESAGTILATGLTMPESLAFDATGRIYVTSSTFDGALIRLEADGSAPTALLSIRGPCNVDFGTGPLNCRDLYVASGGGLVRYEMGDQPGAEVPWH